MREPVNLRSYCPPFFCSAAMLKDVYAAVARGELSPHTASEWVAYKRIPMERACKPKPRPKPRPGK
jgi:hypothetical protein